jgi:hypothetical protein
MTGNPASIMARTLVSMAAAGLVEGRDYKLINEYAHPSSTGDGRSRSLPVPDAPRGRSVPSHAAPPPPAQNGGQPTQVNVHLDGSRIAQVVTRHQVRGANGPSQGGSAADYTRIMPQVA